MCRFILLIIFLFPLFADPTLEELYTKGKNSLDHHRSINYLEPVYQKAESLELKMNAATQIVWRRYYLHEYAKAILLAEEALMFQQTSEIYFAASLSFIYENHFSKATHCCQRGCELIVEARDWSGLIHYREEVKKLRQNSETKALADKVFQEVEHFLKNYSDSAMTPELRDKDVLLKHLILQSAVIRNRKQNGKKWDAGWGKVARPDVKIKLYQESFGEWKLIFESEMIKNSLQPSWQKNTQIKITPAMYLKVEVFDQDLRVSDPIGQYTFVGQEIFDQGTTNFAFEQVESLSLELKTIE